MYHVSPVRTTHDHGPWTRVGGQAPVFTGVRNVDMNMGHEYRRLSTLPVFMAMNTGSADRCPCSWPMNTGSADRHPCSQMSETSAVNMGHEHGRLSTLPVFMAHVVRTGACVHGPWTRVVQTGPRVHACQKRRREHGPWTPITHVHRPWTRVMCTRL